MKVPCLLWFRGSRGVARLCKVALSSTAAVVATLVVWPGVEANLSAAPPIVSRFAGPTSSQPLALTADGAFLVAANPDNDSVSFFDVRADRNRKVAEVPVQTEPNGVAFHPNGSKAYVANTVSGTVSVIPTNIANGIVRRPTKHIVVGTEPYGLALTPNGTKLYVTNARSNDVSVIDTATDTVMKTIPVAFEPRGLAITNDGDSDDSDELVYVTHFLSFLRPGKIDGQDDAKAGLVTVIPTVTDTPLTQVVLNPISDTGFRAAGDALARIPPGTTFAFPTGAYPNQLNNIAIRGNFAYVPNTGASPNGPVRFDVNTQSLLSVINRSSAIDAGHTINMHKAVDLQINPSKLFVTVPWAMAFEHQSDQGYVVSAASDILVKVVVHPGTGAPEVQLDPADPTRVLQIKVGKNPRGIVINPTDTRAYVMNYVSRNVSVVNLGTEQVIASMASAALPTPGTLADKIQIGRELYNTSVGTFDPLPATTTPIAGRMSDSGWGSCASCHPSGLSDNAVWIFASGPRRTIPQHTDFDQTDPARSIQRALNWSAIFDEQEDFELNIRNVSGGAGIITVTGSTVPDTAVTALTPLANANRNQLKVRGVGGWDAIKAFVQFGIRAPISPVPDTDFDAISGRALFAAANCQQCHGGPQWTSSRVRFTPPPNPALIVNTQIISELRQVGTFDPAFFNEVRANAATPLGANGFAPASLLSIFAFPGTLLHNGAAPTLDAVLLNVQHRSAGTGGVDTLTNPSDRARVARFLQSIDAGTVPFP